ncbi:hypothetical protein G6F57_007487 [Rhizopus arrhizus]|uniref:Methyltransferase type 11 domain-containing protein n=1 Tax=Rhizopus oryzae TaxID=64495 RepID=A0A9P6XFN7_RHIOR|nr:hypothetical protein G6F23_002875 [Rhizopus arrhizus]KAG1421747.1 hypothetical protein G6F58_003624 [Rhizopus delemar]KAG0763884.1 hypothetical protein G6F24_005664 [Rhizopus arrhizus]KAG0788381.1 hypothetical protein G6F21_007251 [Rhizopus arrhizus]KAG0801415.1 hypothetical protein G6F22_001272 [Rhizopus arrhizus]
MSKVFLSKMVKPHPTALNGFQNQASAYVKARPTYPKESLDFIANLLPPSSTKILDLGAGTGIMTDLLFKKGFQVTAVEPVQGMLDKLQEALPQVTALKGNSWSIPVESNSQDAVVLAQCFHWFSDIKSLQELHRVLKPGGYLFLIWNLESRDRSEWIGKLRDLYEQHELSAPQYRHGKWKDVFNTEEAKSLYTLPLQHQRFNNDIPTVRSLVWTRILSKSYVAILNEEEQEKLHQKVEKVMNDYQFPADDNETFIYRHDTDLFWCQKK